MPCLPPLRCYLRWRKELHLVMSSRNPSITFRAAPETSVGSKISKSKTHTPKVITKTRRQCRRVITLSSPPPPPHPSMSDIPLPLRGQVAVPPVEVLQPGKRHPVPLLLVVRRAEQGEFPALPGGAPGQRLVQCNLVTLWKHLRLAASGEWHDKAQWAAVSPDAGHGALALSAPCGRGLKTGAGWRSGL